MNEKVKAMQAEFNRNMDSIIESIKEASGNKKEFVENLKKSFPCAGVTIVNIGKDEEDELECVSSVFPFVKNLLDEFESSISSEDDNYKACTDSLENVVEDDTAAKYIFLGKTLSVQKILLEKLENNLTEYEMSLVTAKCIKDMLADSKKDEKAE